MTEAYRNLPGVGYYEMTCQDVMFSGHTAMGTLWSLFTLVYFRKSPWFPKAAMSDRSPFWQLRMIGEVLIIIWMFFGWFVIVASHFHYSVDVCVGILLTFVVFHSYHGTIAEVQEARAHHTSMMLVFKFLRFVAWMEKGAKDIRHRILLQVKI